MPLLLNRQARVLSFSGSVVCCFVYQYTIEKKISSYAQIQNATKETWALQQGLCVIRVLQEDGWNDRLDWQGWILRSIEAARECGDARVFTPAAPEYRSNESAYVKLHESGTVPTP